MRSRLRAAAAAAVLTALPLLSDAQRVRPVFAPDQAVPVLSRFQKTERTDRRSHLPVDSATARDKTPYVLGGAILGAIAGAYLYRREVDKLNDADFGVGYSIPIFVGGGAALGALLGYFVGSFGDPPEKRESGHRRFAPAPR
jgi:hypothetical protein